MAVHTKEKQFELIKQNPENLKDIDNQYEDVCIEAIKQYAWSFRHVKEQTLRTCIEAVRQNGYVLISIKNQTPDICLEAVRKNGLALEYVKEQTPKICLEAVKQDIRALEYVKEQTPEFLLEAVKTNGEIVKKIRSKTPELCFYALLNRNDLNEYKYIQKGILAYINKNPILTNKIFCLNYTLYKDLNNKNTKEYEVINLNINSLRNLQNILIEDGHNNYFVFNESVFDLELIKKIALSNNNIIYVDEEKEVKNPIAKSLVNKILTREELFKESF